MQQVESYAAKVIHNRIGKRPPWILWLLLTRKYGRRGQGICRRAAEAKVQVSGFGVWLTWAARHLQFLATRVRFNRFPPNADFGPASPGKEVIS